jgi:hypothetical protein
MGAFGAYRVCVASSDSLFEMALSNWNFII